MLMTKEERMKLEEDFLLLSQKDFKYIDMSGYARVVFVFLEEFERQVSSKANIDQPGYTEEFVEALAQVQSHIFITIASTISGADRSPDAISGFLVKTFGEMFFAAMKCAEPNAIDPMLIRRGNDKAMARAMLEFIALRMKEGK